MFGISLTVLHLPIRAIAIFVGIGIPLVVVWLYLDDRRKQELTREEINKEKCACPTCKHDTGTLCFDAKCPCCIILKGKTITGHAVSNLQ